MTRAGAEVTEQSTLAVAIVAVGVCGICFMLIVPAMAVEAVRGNIAGAVRLLTFGVALAAVALTVSAVLGATPAAYSILA